jgi:hypothetical protein
MLAGFVFSVMTLTRSRQGSFAVVLPNVMPDGPVAQHRGR